MGITNRKGWILQGDTLEETAEKAGIDGADLKKTVALFNENFGSDKPDPLGRKQETMAPISRPPFYADERCLAIVNTQGGPKHNHRAQTLDHEGRPIPRLYTPGEWGSFFGHLYQGGSTLPEALAFGIIAGEGAAQEEPW